MKTILTKLLMLTAVLSASTNLYAYDFEVDGIYYEILDVTELTCEVVKGENDYIGNITVPQTVIFNGRGLTVASIDKAFSNCSKLKSIVIPNGILNISSSAFIGCYELEEVVIQDSDRELDINYDNNTKILFSDSPIKKVYLGRNLNYDYTPFGDSKTLISVTVSNSVTTIGYNAFKGCSSLTNIEIPDSVTTIENGAFYGCSSLTNIEIPDSVMTIGDDSFYNGVFQDCSSLTSIKLSNSITIIDYHTFYGCSSLTNIEIPNSVTVIKSNAFTDCSSLTNIEIPSNVKEIYGGAFDNCSSLTNVQLSNGLTVINWGAFRDCSSLTSIKIPNSVTMIHYNAFGNCSKLKTLIFEDGQNEIRLGDPEEIGLKTPPFHNCPLENIYLGRDLNYDKYGFEEGGSGKPLSPFYGMNSLLSVTIGNTVNRINELLFAYCSNLKNVTIGSNVTEIEWAAFTDCPNLSVINSLNPVPPTIVETTFDVNHYLYATLNIPYGSLNAYRNNKEWNGFWNIEEKFNVSGLNSAETINVAVTAKDGSIAVNGTDNAVVEVYNLSGQLVYSGTDNVINVPSKGIYIVRVSGQTFKVIL